LESVNDVKDLGVIISEDLKWEKQCSAYNQICDSTPTVLTVSVDTYGTIKAVYYYYYYY